MAISVPIPIPWESYSDKELILSCEKCGKDIEIGAKFFAYNGCFLCHPECKEILEQRILKHNEQKHSYLSCFCSLTD